MICFHSKITIKRAHQESEFGQAHGGVAVCIDEHGCYVFLRCAKCRAFLCHFQNDDGSFTGAVNDCYWTPVKPARAALAKAGAA